MTIRGVIFGGVLFFVADTATNATAVFDHTQATSSFVPPTGCLEDKLLAVELQLVMACVQRFSPTHEFVIVLREFRRRHLIREEAVDAEMIAREAVAEKIDELRAANEGQPGQTLALFEPSQIPREKPKPAGADHCSLVPLLVIDSRVPGYGGEEFRIWGQAYVCARVDVLDNSVQLVVLHSSERFRVKTDRFRERFEALAPLASALEATKSLKMR